MLMNIMFFEFVFSSDLKYSAFEYNTLSFCTDCDIRVFEYVPLTKDSNDENFKIQAKEKQSTDILIDFENINVSTTLKDSNSYIYTISYKKSRDKDAKIIMYNQLNKACISVMISSCPGPNSSYKFESIKSIGNTDQATKAQNNFVSKELMKTMFPNDTGAFVLGNSNLGLMKLLTDFEFYSITKELKQYVFKPMVQIFKEIRKFYSDTKIGSEKLNQISVKFNHFFSVMKDASIMKYNFFISVDLEWAYLNSVNMSFDQDKILKFKQILLSETLDKLSSAIWDILSDIQVIKGSGNFMGTIADITKLLTNIKKFYGNKFELNKNIQEEKFTCPMSKEDKIRQFFEFLQLVFDQLNIIIGYSELTRDFYVHFKHDKKYNETCNYFFSLVCILDVQKKLLKDCLENPTLKNLLSYMNLENVENYKVKDLQSSWMMLKDSCKMLKGDIIKHSESSKAYEDFRIRFYDLEKQSFELNNRIDFFITEFFYLSDLSLKSNILTFLLVNNEDIIKCRDPGESLIFN